MSATALPIEKRTADPAGALVEIPKPEPDLIDRIAASLPEEVRAEYYRELRHCRSLPESDEMLRLLRAMQFLVLLIEQAPSRVAEERGKLDKLLATTVDRISAMGAASEAYHSALQHKLTVLPFEVANGINAEAVAAQINENLRQEFIQSTIPKTAQALGEISERMKKIGSEFSVTSDNLSNEHRGAAEDARKALASLKSEISQATENAAAFRREVEGKFSKVYHLSLAMIAGGSLVLGLAIGMILERWVLFGPEVIVQPAAPVVQLTPQQAKLPPTAPKATDKK